MKIKAMTMKRNSKVGGASKLDSKVGGASKLDSKVGGASKLDSKVGGASKLDSKVGGASKLLVTNSATLRALIARNNEDNLQKLEKLGILDRFVEENNGNWDHQTWINLCELIEKHDLGPIDFDKVGLILEEKKAKHFFLHQMTCIQTGYANLNA